VGSCTREEGKQGHVSNREAVGGLAKFGEWRVLDGLGVWEGIV
jgi:hypothetical protein